MEPFLAEIRIFPYNFAPRGWALCDGQILAIAQNTALFSLVGTIYGGDGKSTFALPNIKGNVVMGVGTGPNHVVHVPGESSGESTVTLTLAQMAAHTHSLMVHSQDPGEINAPSPLRALARANGGNAYGPAASLVPLSNFAVTPTGQDRPHNNMHPYLALNYCIALQGVFPSRP